MRWLAATLAALITVGTAIAQPAGDAPSITAADWQAYRTKFLDPSGRIIDDANGEISHSEGQGYGMLLAYLAGNRADFDLIWSFTRTELLLRDDGLATWRWDPKSTPHVTDINNATDGDILIAYALALGGDTWKAPELSQAASDLIGAIRKTTIVEHEGRSLLLPGVSGFSATDRPDDGPVVNLSYWVYEAFPTFGRIDPDPV
ncbi:glycosyl hydrolase family 8, partial [Rhizobiaceae sp. 2RAB30]